MSLLIQRMDGMNLHHVNRFFVQSNPAILYQLKNHTLNTCTPSWRSLIIVVTTSTSSRHKLSRMEAQPPWRQEGKLPPRKQRGALAGFQVRNPPFAGTELQKSPWIKCNQWQRFVYPQPSEFYPWASWSWPHEPVP